MIESEYPKLRPPKPPREAGKGTVYEPILITATPSESEGKNDVLASMLMTLKRQVVTDNTGLTLVPLGQNYGGTAEAAIKFLHAWNDPILRQGYLPTTPRTYEKTKAILDKWFSDPLQIVYLYNALGGFSIDGYLRFDFTPLTPARLPNTEVWVTYGLLDPDKTNQGFTANALALAMKHMEKFTDRAGIPLIKYTTSVSDRNIASQQILLNTGFSYDPTRAIEPSPAIMGGNSYPMVRYVKKYRHLSTSNIS